MSRFGLNTDMALQLGWRESEPVGTQLLLTLERPQQGFRSFVEASDAIGTAVYHVARIEPIVSRPYQLL